MVFSVLCFFFKPASWHLLLYQYRSIYFDTPISKQHNPIKSCVPCAPFIFWAPAPPKVSARPCKPKHIKAFNVNFYSWNFIHTSLMELYSRQFWSSWNHVLLRLVHALRNWSLVLMWADVKDGMQHFPVLLCNYYFFTSTGVRQNNMNNISLLRWLITLCL